MSIFQIVISVLFIRNFSRLPLSHLLNIYRAMRLHLYLCKCLVNVKAVEKLQNIIHTNGTLSKKNGK